MRLRTFHAQDMPSAMKMVREALGENAIILATDSQKGKKGISVTAAVDPDAPSPGRGEGGEGASLEGLPGKPPPRPSPRPGEGENNLTFEIQNILRFHNIPEHFVSKMVQKASTKEFMSLSALHHISANRDEKPVLRLLLEKVLASYFQYAPLTFDTPQRLMLIGPPGIGKTLTVAKLATRLTMDKHAVSVFTTDNQRAGGIEQLQAFTDILETPLQAVSGPSELSRALAQLPDDANVLIDTAGCNPYDIQELKVLKSLCAQRDVEPVMVLPAGGDSAETIDIVEAFAAIPIKRLLITRADTARRFGGVVAAAAAHKLAFCQVSTSSSIVNSLDPVDGAVLVQMLLRYQLQTR